MFSGVSDRAARTGPGRSRRLLQGMVLSVAALVVTALLVATGLALAGGDEVPGSHNDHGRFTAQAQGFPPQPAEATVVRPLAQPFFQATQDDPSSFVAVAERDARVRAAIPGRTELIGVESLDAKSEHPGGALVTWFAYPTDGPGGDTVRAIVADGRVLSVRVTPAGVWQPPLTGAEVDRAVTIARSSWVDDGHDEAEDLQGFTIHAMEDGGAYPDTRLAYVSFHAHVDARPRLVSWVDLSQGVVIRDRVEPPSGADPAAPTFAQQDGTPADVPRTGSITWNDWTLGYDVSGRMDGISIDDVRLDGVRVLARASMPSMTVFYDDDACGPFVDRLGGELTPVDWADGAEVVIREFQQRGQDWLELGILDTLGDYVLYQVFYLSADGQIDAHTFAKGLQCNVDHAHYPFWRFDVDLDGPEGDVIRRRTDTGWAIQTVEFDRPADDAVEHGWQVRDVATGHRIDVMFDDGSWNVPGLVMPEVAYSTNEVSGRRFEPGESGTWTYPAVTGLPGADGDDIAGVDGSGQDVVLWYRGFLPHTSAEGPSLWHSTGVRLDVRLADGHFVRPR